MDDRPLAVEPGAERVPARGPGAGDHGVATASYGRRPGENGEEIQRVHVEPEDRLAFRVGVNILTLALLVLAGDLVWRNFLQ